MKGKMIIALLPVAFIIFIVLIIVALLTSLFGNQEMTYKTSFVLPFDTNNFTITSDYGLRDDPFTNEKSKHNGIDVVPVNTKNIVAIADGKVVASTLDSADAEYVLIEHKINGTTYRSGYWHLEENSRTVNVGDEVKQGQQVGIMGMTGRATGVHLHLVLQVYNAKTNQFEYTDPTTIIKNKITAKDYILYDYNSKSFNNPFDNLPTTPEFNPLPNLNN